jgi:hypothetical protein
LKAIVLERNKLVGRRIARIWTCSGLAAVCIEDPKDLEAVLGGAARGAALLGADAFDADVVRAALQKRRDLVGALWTAEPLDRVLRHVTDEPRISNVFGRASFESTPREWELSLVARRLGNGHREATAIPFGAFLRWGHTGLKHMVSSTAERDAAVAHVQRYVDKLGLPRRVGEMFGELAHELLMNALYDAPADASGRPRHAHDRKAPVTLGPEEAATLRVGCDGVSLGIQVTDPFGRLQRRHVFDGLARGLRGQMDPSHGGAGLGMTVCLGSTVALVFEVSPGERTTVTGLFDLDLNLREFRNQAKSLHFFADVGS